MEHIGTILMIWLPSKMDFMELYELGKTLSICRLLTQHRIANLEYICFNSPSPKRETPFSMITNNTTELESIRTAEKYPELIMVSDWSQYTSFEYMDAMKQTGYDIL